MGDARSYGLELEGSYRPFKALTLSTSLGWNETEYRGFVLDRVSFVTGEEFATDVSGNALANAPASTALVAIDYAPRLAKNLRGEARVDYRRVGRFFTDIQNAIEQEAYGLVNARVGVRWKGYGLFVWGRNLNDAAYLAFGAPDSSFGRRVRTAAPRTYGFTLSASF